MPPNTTSFHSPSLSSTHRFASHLAPLLQKYRIITFSGELGTGKTTLIRFLASEIGLSSPISSPTYAFMHSHSLPPNQTLYHWDFYRLTTALSAESLGFFELLHTPNTLHLIEWPELIKFHLPLPHLSVHCQDNPPGKTYTLQKNYLLLPPLSSIPTLWESFFLPPIIRSHCQKVASLAYTLASHLKSHNYPANPLLAYTASLLHDLLRPLDFKTSKTGSTTHTLRQRFPNLNHEKAAAQYLTSLGYPLLGHTIQEHRFESLTSPSSLPLTPTGKVVYYADKRIMHDSLVSLQERFQDGRKRNQHLLPPNLEQIEKNVFLLEKELFSYLPFTPSNLPPLTTPFL